ncbi:hypothetical protein ACQP1K_06275 [Sphaerimonospora sp. CA-214678]|uniref:hypothetical protein n=1 Tax=Sphaerimonospora sp. CA-214678 TaxID=3240029 RepID=UPI003D8CAA2E
MAEGGADPAEHGRGTPFIRSYEAHTTPLPRVRPEERSEPESSALLADLARTQEFRAVTVGTGRREHGMAGRAVRAVRNVPRRGVYTIAAVIGTVIAIVLVFLVFSDDKPRRDAGSGAAGAVRSPTVTPSASPSPRPALPTLPRVPSRRNMPVHPGPGTPVAAYVTDREAGISYARFGTPWRETKLAPFEAVQRAGAVRHPQAVIGSAPYPGAPGAPTAYADYRRLAARAARWSLRYQPPGAKLTWTASQPVRRGMGWLLGYRVRYVIDGEQRSSQAIVAIVGTGRSKPAMLFATVPDDRAERYRDLNMLAWTISPI